MIWTRHYDLEGREAHEKSDPFADMSDHVKRVLQLPPSSSPPPCKDDDPPPPKYAGYMLDGEQF